jgi:hypothetical protein
MRVGFVGSGQLGLEFAALAGVDRARQYGVAFQGL